MVWLMSDGELTRLEVLRMLDRKTIDDRGGSAIAEAGASSGVPAVEGVPDPRVRRA